MATIQTRERPILFSGPMVRSLLAGTKTQTRRVVKPQPTYMADVGVEEVYDVVCGPERYEPIVVGRDGEERVGKMCFGIYTADGEWGCKCPYEPGMRPWVRETWRWYGRYRNNQPEGGMEYRADLATRTFDDFPDRLAAWKAFDLEMICGGANKWKPSIHMPRWASRLTLEITNVRVERVQSISAKDIIAEGAVDRPHHVDGLGKCPVSAFDGKCYVDLKLLWAAGWDSINRKKHPWKSNPWVYVIEFKRASRQAEGT